MFGRRVRRGQQRPAPEWTRQKMLALLIGAGVCAVVLLVGLVLAVVYYVHPGTAHAQHPHRGASNSSGGGAGGPGGSQAAAADPRDALAAKPMSQVGEDASQPGAVSTANPGKPVLIPAATIAGPARVPTGFPHTPAGALAQLTAIDQVAMQSLSLDTARQVIVAWAIRGGPTAESWSVIHALAQLFGELGVSAGSVNQLSLVLTPVMGQIKGTVGPDYVIPCIDFEMDLTLAQTARGAIADCQRMVWVHDPGLSVKGRWQIGAGAEPATPPSVWPDTDLAIAVGYHDLRKEP
jgi:hypothetical protein